MRVALAQHPRFPQHIAMEIVSELFSPELIQIIKNMRANPFVRKQAELHFLNKYRRLLLGEKKSLLRIAPAELLKKLVDENHPDLLEIIFKSTYCTHEVVLYFIHQHKKKKHLYQALSQTEWVKVREVAAAIAQDAEAPVKILIQVIPFLSAEKLKKLLNSEDTHGSVKEAIRNFFEKRKEPAFF